MGFMICGRALTPNSHTSSKKIPGKNRIFLCRPGTSPSVLRWMKGGRVPEGVSLRPLYLYYFSFIKPAALPGIHGVIHPSFLHKLIMSACFSNGSLV